jgi:hypothetical protein
MPLQDHRLSHVAPLPISVDREEAPVPIAPVGFQTDGTRDEDREPVFAALVARISAGHWPRISGVSRLMMRTRSEPHASVPPSIA